MPGLLLSVLLVASCWTPAAVAPAGRSYLSAPPAGHSVFAQCGAGEAGLEVLRGEGDSPFRSGNPYCCGNSTWSTFRWRARATHNIPFRTSLEQQQQQPAGTFITPAEACAAGLPDCFSFCFNRSDHQACSSYTPAGSWGAWQEFAKDAAFWCHARPNSGLDPIQHLVVPLYVQGVRFGMMSKVTVEVEPGGARAGEPNYHLNATLSHIAPSWQSLSVSWPRAVPAEPAALQLPCMVARENLTTSRAVDTARNADQRLWRAVSAQPRRGLPGGSRTTPLQIEVGTGYHGGAADVRAWEDATQALVRMGISTLHSLPSADLRAVFAEAGVPVAGFEGNFVQDALYQGNLSRACGTYALNHSRPDDDHCWGRSDQEVTLHLQQWAESVMGPMRAAGFCKFGLMSLHDELSCWHFGGSTDFWAGNNNVSGNPRVLQRYHSYLMNSTGMHSPLDFGESHWDDVLPNMTRSVMFARIAAAGAGGGGSGAAAHARLVEGLRRRFYWTVRFAAWDVATWYAQVTAALIAANAGEAFTSYINLNNFHGRVFTPDDGPSGADCGGLDWFEAGRVGAGTMMWTEDWWVARSLSPPVRWLGSYYSLLYDRMLTLCVCALLCARCCLCLCLCLCLCVCVSVCVRVSGLATQRRQNGAT
jgi:hypothetical protein